MFFIGPAGYPEGSRNPLDALETVKAKGLNALEVQFVRQARMGEEKARGIGERARQLGVHLSAHAPYYINFNSISEETVEKSIQWVVRTVEIAQNMGARIVVLHAALYHGKEPMEVTKLVSASLEKCLAIMRENGLDGPLLGLETAGKKAAWGRISEIGEVVSSMDRIVPVLDFGHLHAIKGGALHSSSEIRECIEEVKSFHNGNLHCHYSSVEFGDRGERKHLPLEKGEPPFEAIANVLREWSGDVTIISETPSPTEGACKMLEVLENKPENRIQ